MRKSDEKDMALKKRCGDCKLMRMRERTGRRENEPELERVTRRRKSLQGLLPVDQKSH